MLLSSITDRSVSPGSTVRTLIPSKSADYSILVTDRGAVAMSPGITFTLPPFFQPFLGESVFIVNLSTGNLTVKTVDGEFIKSVAGDQIQDIIPAASSRSYLRETDSMKWVATGTASAVIRMNRPQINGDYQLSQNEMGVVLNSAGSTCTLPAYNSFQRGLEYGVKNGSPGLVNVSAASGDAIVVQGQLVQSVVIPSDFSRQFARETTTNHWVII